VHLYNKIIKVQCFSCVNFIGKRKGETYLQCKAFPKGIPDDILTGKNDHTKKYPKQENDIVFEPINEGGE